MPSVTITISAWWAVAIAAQLAWLFVFAFGYRRVVAGLRRRNQWWNTPDWVDMVGYILVGPIGWVGAIWDAVETRRSRRRNQALRDALAVRNGPPFAEPLDDPEPPQGGGGS